jgi:hypothetical protein
MKLFLMPVGFLYVIYGTIAQLGIVPFARDSQNYVNAAMVIKASTTDTSFEYRCDWQYKTNS